MSSRVQLPPARDIRIFRPFTERSSSWDQGGDRSADPDEIGGARSDMEHLGPDEGECRQGLFDGY